MKRVLTSVCLTLALFVGQAVYAASPTETIKHMTHKMVVALKKNNAELQKPGVIESIVNKDLVPHVDMPAVAGRVVGRQAWVSASPSVRSTFIKEFKTVMVNTYTGALSSFDDDAVKVYPLRAPAVKVAQVRTEVVRRNGQHILMVYNLKKKSSGWKIYDISIENVSLIDNYKEQYAGAIEQGGLSFLTQKLAQRRGR